MGDTTILEIDKSILRLKKYARGESVNEDLVFNNHGIQYRLSDIEMIEIPQNIPNIFLFIEYLKSKKYSLCDIDIYYLLKEEIQDIPLEWDKNKTMILFLDQKTNDNSCSYFLERIHQEEKFQHYWEFSFGSYELIEKIFLNQSLKTKYLIAVLPHH